MPTARLPIDAAHRASADAHAIGAVTGLQAALDAKLGWMSRSGASSTCVTLLDAGLSTAISVLGDSTGNGTDEWVYLLSQKLAAAYPAHTVQYHMFSDAAQSYGAPTVIQSGGAERYARFPGGQFLHIPAARAEAITGDIDVRVKCSLDDVTPAVENCIVSRFGVNGARAWRLGITASGRVYFQWSTDGTTLSPYFQSSENPPWTDGAALWLRATLTVAAGQVMFYTSSDGYTWSQLGSIPTPAGATALFGASLEEVELGTRGASTGATSIVGNVYEVDIRAGVGGYSTVPRLPEHWDNRIAGMGLVGAPRLDVFNGSVSGANLSYLYASATRLKSMLPTAAQSLIYISDGHSESLRNPSGFSDSLTPYIAAIRERVPLARIVLVAQNPKYSPALYVVPHAARMSSLSGIDTDCGVLDVFGAFSDTAGLVGSDGIHPTSDGSILWADTAYTAFIERG